MRILRVALATALLPLAVMLAAGRAHAVLVSPGAANGLAGQTVDVNINTSNLTGLNVRSLQFELTYNPTMLTATDVLEAGNLVGNAGWGDAEYHLTSLSTTVKRIELSAAGNTPLTGSGALLRIRFLINPALINGGSSSLALSNLVFNEGTPNDTTANATFTINVTPQIAVNPDVAEIIRGLTVNFAVTGTVANPVSWFTTNPALATISGTGVLTGVAPGEVKVYAVDNAGRRDTTDGVVSIRGMGISATTTSFVTGQTGTVPIVVTSLTGLGIRSGQFRVTFNGAMVTATGVTTPAGTLLNGWGPTLFHAEPSACVVDFAGSSDLSGSGVLCYLKFVATGIPTGSSSLIFDSALFNETLPAKRTNGTLNLLPLPSITVSPEDITLLAGQTQQFTLSGTPTPPVTWSVLDPTIATISPTGLLTAVKGGGTRVRALDNLGAIDLNNSVTVHDFKLTVSTVKGPPGSTVRVSLNSDRLVGSLGIMSMQYVLTWSGVNLIGAKALDSGLAGLWAPEDIVDLNNNPSIRVAAAGVSPLDDSGNEVHALEFKISPSAPLGTVIPLTISSLVFNEGLPSITTVNGSIQVSASADVPASARMELALAPCEPNPLQGVGRLRFSLPQTASGGDPVRLTIHGLDGGRVRTLVDGIRGPGAHEVRWDGRDESGNLLAPGLYFTRLEWRGNALSKKLTVTR